MHSYLGRSNVADPIFTFRRTVERWCPTILMSEHVCRVEKVYTSTPYTKPNSVPIFYQMSLEFMNSTSPKCSSSLISLYHTYVQICVLDF